MKKFVSLILMFGLILSLAGCGEGQSDEPDIRDMVYDYEILPCMSEIKGDINFYKIMEDSIYICSTEWADAGEGQPAQFFYKCDKEGKNLVNIPYVSKATDEEWLYSMEVNKKGNLILLYSSYSNDSVQNRFLLREITEDGTQMKEIDIAEETGEEDIFIQYTKMDKDGNIYLLSDLSVYILDGEGAFKGALKEDNLIACLVKTADGEILAGFDYTSGFTLKKVDAENLVFGETYQTGIPYYSISAFADGGEYDFYYSDGEGLYGYHLADRESVKFTDWVGSDMNSNYIGTLQIVSREKIYAIYGNNDEDSYGLYVLHKMDPKDVKVKERITYVSLYPDEEVKKRAIRFNREQEKYQVVVKDYSMSEFPEEDMYKDLMAGGAFDMIDLSGVSSDKYAAKGYFVDLYSWMDKDKDIKREDFLENALKVMETDGKLYRITPTFGLNGMLMHAEKLQSDDPQSPVRLRDMEKNGAQAFYMETNNSILSLGIEMNYADYINWQKGECYFDSSDFMKLLEYANTYPAEDQLEWDERTKSITSMIREGKVLAASVYHLSTADIQLYEKMFEGEFSMRGFSPENLKGSALSMDREFAICESSKHKNGAWEFLKTYLTRENISSQFVSADYVGTSIRKDSLEDQIRRFSITEASEDDFGNVLEPVSYEWEFDDIQLMVGPLKENQVSLYRKIINAADHRYVYDADVIMMAQEEAGDYFNGEISAEEAASNIQERVSVYMEDYR